MKKLKRLITVLLIIALFILVINIIPPKKNVENNPFISKDGKTMLAAHRGGAINNPENTMKAFKEAVYNYEVDILESDLYLTKDNELVFNHDSYINDTSDVVEITKQDKKHYISDYTLRELKEFNFGYQFKDSNGNYPYRDIVSFDDPDRGPILTGNGLSIITLEDVFKEFYENNKDLLFIIEIKNGGEAGFKAADIINETLTTKYPDYLENVVIGTFKDEINQYLKDRYPYLLRGASMGVAAKFIITEMLKVNLFDNSDFACLQIPMAYDIKGIEIKLNKKQYIKRAHKRNIAVQYWTINDETEMRELIELGCDAIMTDDPALLRKVLNQY